MSNNIDPSQEMQETPVVQAEQSKTINFTDLSPEMRKAAVQEAANLLVAQFEKQLGPKPLENVDAVHGYITQQLMFIHMQALTNLFVSKGLVSEASIEEALAKAFATAAAGMANEVANAPKILVPKH